MKTVLGIGTAGANIVTQLAKYKQYKPYLLSPEVAKNSKYRFKLPEFSSPEDYEKMQVEKLHKWLDSIETNCTVFLCGASNSSGVTLRALEHLHKKGLKIEIVYFAPEVEVLSEIKSLNQRAVMGILQNYARSGVFEKICLVSNLSLEVLAGSTNVFEYYKQINEVFVSTYYMLDVFKNTKPITSTFTNPKESCRITTIGLGTLEEAESMFFPFDQEVEVVYYFGINEEKLKTEENLFRKITNKVKSRITDNTRVSFGIYPTQYEEDYIYVEYFSPKIQELKETNE